MKCFGIISILVFCLCVPAFAASQDEAGRVKTVKGLAFIVRQDRTVQVARDEKIYSGDILKTGADGSLGAMFKDDTILSLGPNTTITVDSFLFAPAQGKLSFVVRLMKGTASYISGVIAKLSPQSVRFETPVATVGIRGTKILVSIDEEAAR